MGFFEKSGKKFAEGIKKEAANPETWDKVMDILLKIGIFAVFVFAGKSEKNKTQTVIVNNYISGTNSTH